MSIAQEISHLADEYDPLWRISSSMLFAMEPLLERVNPKNILEFGPGLSSHLLYKWARRNGAAYASIDHVGPYAEKHSKLMNQYTSLDQSRFLVIPLSPTDYWYALDEMDFRVSPLDTAVPFDFVFVDGPEQGRSCDRAMAFYNRFIAAAATWVIDDTHRIEEQNLVKRLSPLYKVRNIKDVIFPPRVTTILSRMEL